MTKNGVSPDAIELIVVNEAGVRILRSSAHWSRRAREGRQEPVTWLAFFVVLFGVFVAVYSRLGPDTEMLVIGLLIAAGGVWMWFAALAAHDRLRALKQTGIRCPTCHEPVAVIESSTPPVTVMRCPNCGHRWSAGEQVTPKHWGCRRL
jgi:hypothetical protein